MNDKELLEAAANATGRRWKWTTSQKYKGRVPGMHHLDSVNNVDYFFEWNPLEDDDDAMKLLTGLRLSVMFDDRESVQVSASGKGDKCAAFAMEPLASNAGIATRLAIVRAAAALARP